ncbi:MAG: hypothetical protein ACRBFS_16935 [Aureispira sp.]
MIRWHGLLVGLFVLNILVKSYQIDPNNFLKGVFLTYTFLSIISVIRWSNGPIKMPLAFLFVLLCLSNLVIQLIFLGNDVFMWMIKHMGSIPAP